MERVRGDRMPTLWSRSILARSRLALFVLGVVLAATPVPPFTEVVSAGGRSIPPAGHGCGPAPRPGPTPGPERPERTPRPARTPKPSTTPSPEPTPDATPTGQPTMEPDPTQAPEPTPDATAPPTPDPTPDRTRPPDPEPTAEPERTPRPDPTREPEPEPTREPEHEPEPLPESSPLAMVGLTQQGPVADPLEEVRHILSVLVAAILAWLSGSASPSADLPHEPEGRRLPPARRPDPGRDGRVRGLDVSHWNGVVDHAAASRGGFAFVIVKATQGTYLTDPMLRRNLAAAREAGLIVGAYHFYDHRQGGREQADHMLAVLGAAGALDDALPPVVDVECFAPFGTADQAMVRRELRAFSDRVVQETGRLPMIYTSGHMWEELTGDDPRFGDHPLWVACWRCPEPYLPPGWDDWLVWQVGSMDVPGRRTRLDGNVARGQGHLRRAVGPSLVAAERGRVARITGVDGGSRIRVAVGDEAWSAWGSRSSVRLPSTDGRHRVRWRVRSSRRIVGPVREAVVVVDRTPPEIRVGAAEVETMPLARTAVRPVTVPIRVRDSVSGVARLDHRVVCGGVASPWTRVPPGTSRLAVSMAADGSCHVEVRARDRQGNRAVIAADPVRASDPSDEADAPSTACCRAHPVHPLPPPWLSTGLSERVASHRKRA